MSSVALARPRWVALERMVWIVGAVLAAAIVLLIRVRQLHPAPLYPDGYQYLAMARDIAAHGRPAGPLAHGGDAFVPSADAAAKPLFPALVALLSLSGVGLASAARAIAATGAAATVLLAGAVAHRLSGSRLAGMVAAAACLASPSLAYWSGFAGPDTLAPALVLGAALSLLHRRIALAGLLAGLACATRPELVIPLAAAALGAAVVPRLRADALRGATWAALTLAALLGAVRPPLVLPHWPDLAAAAALALAGAGLLALALLGPARRPRQLTLAPNVNRRPLVAAALALVPPAAVAVRAGGSPGAADLARHDWPLLLAAVAGGALALAGRRTRGSAAVILVASGLLATAYLAKNPASGRYLALLVPAAAILTGLGIGSVRGARFRLVTTAAGLVAVLGALVIGGPPPPGPDTFGAVAARVRALPPGPLLTAAPDAYGVLLPDRAVRALRPGARGLVLLDAAQRAYEPGDAARGRIVARFEPGAGFRWPDGTLDRGEAVIVRGVVVRAG